MTRVLASSLLLAALVQMVPSGAADAARERPTCQGRPATIVAPAQHAGALQEVEGTEGDDVIVVLGSGNTNIHALGGNDLVCGSDGSDSLFDGPGRDRFYGGPGQDGLWQEAVDRDLFDGGVGFDAVIYYWRTADMYINLRNRKADDGQAGEHDTLISVGSVTTGFGNDVLIAGHEKNRDGHGFPSGQDYYLIAGAGNDTLIGGRRGELMAPGPGQDVVLARAGRDYIDSREGPPGSGFVPEPDYVDGGRDQAADEADCDALDTLINITVKRTC